MSNEAVKFDTELARIYDETRPIDPEVCRACFRDAFQNIVKNKNARIVDIGCGTGRILECLIPQLFQKKQAVGVDISPAMLRVARNKPALLGLEFHNVSAVDFARVPDHQKCFDAVICHWVFHCAPDWQNVFQACVDLVKESGVFAWLEEDGDLYRALDDMDTDNEPLKRLFNAYYASVNQELRALGLGEMDPSSRAGTALRCTENLSSELTVLGWDVQTHSKTHRWTKRVNVDWIIDKIFEPRVFTNLRGIPKEVNARAINSLSIELGRNGLPSHQDCLELKFWARGVSAWRKRIHDSKKVELACYG